MMICILLFLKLLKIVFCFVVWMCLVINLMFIFNGWNWMVRFVVCCFVKMVVGVIMNTFFSLFVIWNIVCMVIFVFLKLMLLIINWFIGVFCCKFLVIFWIVFVWFGVSVNGNDALNCFVFSGLGNGYGFCIYCNFWRYIIIWFIIRWWIVVLVFFFFKF